MTAAHAMTRYLPTPETIELLSLTISREIGAAVSLQSVDLNGRGARHRISFTRGSRIRDVFQAELAECIEALLERLPTHGHAFSDPDFLIELPGLTLARLSVLVRAMADGAAQIVLRFRYFIGSLQNAFRTELRLPLPTLDHRERIAVEALADIATPIFSLALADRAHVRTKEDEDIVLRRLEQLSARACELNFYLTLLTRYVSDCSEARMRSRAEPHAHLQQ
jgi:hypothetical protein